MKAKYQTVKCGDRSAGRKSNSQNKYQSPTKTVELEKVKRNRTALDIKSRFVFIYKEALVYH